MPYFCASKEGNHRHHSCFSHFHSMPQSKAYNKFKPCLTFLLTQRLAMPYYSLIAAKHTPHRSLTSSQFQNHRQSCLCGSSEAHGEYRRIWPSALTQRSGNDVGGLLVPGTTATESRDRAKGEIVGAGEASNGPEEANSTVGMRSSRPLNASARL